MLQKRACDFRKNALSFSYFVALHYVRHKRVTQSSQASDDNVISKRCVHHKQVMQSGEGSKVENQACKFFLSSLPFSDNSLPTVHHVSVE